jgi:hypothetical protein
LSLTLQAILDSLLTGSYKAQWNACYALSSLLSHPGVGRHMAACRQIPLILDRLAHILTTTPNFKVFASLVPGFHRATMIGNSRLLEQ